MVIEKKCRKCFEPKAITEFDLRLDGGYRGKCKPFRFEYERAWKARNADKVEASRDRQRFKDGRKKKFVAPDGFKRCPQCSEVLPLDDFNKGSGATGRYSYCKPCRLFYYRKNRERVLELARIVVARRKREDWAGYRFAHLLNGANKRGIEVAFDKAQFKDWFQSQEPIACAYCRLTRVELEKMGISISVDRKDNSGPYALDNIGIACLCCNKVKLDFLTEADMVEVGKIIRARLLTRYHEQLKLAA